MKKIFKNLLKIIPISILILLTTNSAFTKSSKDYTREECSNLTIKDSTYNDVINRISKLKVVKEFSALLANNESEKVSLMFFHNEAKYINNKCFWYIRIEEDHQTHLAFWKAFLAEIDGNKIYEENSTNNSYQLINQ